MLHAQGVVYTWNSGDIVTGTITPSPGPTTIGSNSTLNIVTTADHDFDYRTVVNNGLVNWNVGNLRAGHGATFTNNASWDDTANGYVFNDAFGGAGGTTFINAAGGTYHKIAGTTTFTADFTNAGTVTVTGNATLSLAGVSTFTNGAVVGSSGSGVVQLTSGTLTATGNITATNFLFNGGTFAGNQTFVSSVLNWQAGNWNTVNTTTIGSSSVLNIFGASDHDFDYHTLVNNGTINWSDGNIRGGHGAQIVNNATWNDTASGDTFNNAFGGAGGTTFVNAVGGSYLKTSGTSNFTTAFNNYGSVVVSGGTLNLVAGGTFFDGSSIGSTGTGVAQLTGGVLFGDGAGGFTANNFLLTSGQVSGNVTFLGTTSWVGSNFNTAVGTATVGTTGTLNITSTADHDYDYHAMVNNGIVNWQSGNVRSGHGGTFTNNGTWNDSANGYSINNAFGGTGGTTFINSATGVYNKTAGVSTIATGILVNNGTISVSGGTLNLQGGTLNNGSSIGSSGSGVVQLTQDVLTANGTINVQNFLLNGGQVAGNQTFTGTLNWQAGNFNNTGSTSIGPGGTLGIVGTGDHDLDYHAFTNNGVVNWSQGNIRGGHGATLTNNATWNDSATSYSISNAYGGTGGTTFINSTTGVYNKTSGTTTFDTGVLVNRGAINVTGGTLNLWGGTFENGSSIGSSGSGLVQLTSGLLTATGTINVQNFLVNGGELGGTHTFAGTLNWQNGTLNNPGSTTIGTAGTLGIIGVSDHDFDYHAIVNSGVVNWSSGALRGGHGATITNNGVWNDAVSGYSINNAYAGAGGTTFVNAAGGTYNKTGGTTTFSTPVTNAGTINVNSGTIALASTFTHTGTVALASGATMTSSTPLVLGVGSIVQGNGSLTATSITSSGIIAPGTFSSAGLLTITGDLSLQAVSETAFELGGTTQNTQYDHLIVNGNVTAGGHLAVKFLGSFFSTVDGSMTFELISTSGITGAFSNVANGGRFVTADGLGIFTANFGTGSAFGVNQVILSNFAPVPEPSTWALLITGAGFLTATCYRRRRA